MNYTFHILTSLKSILSNDQKGRNSRLLKTAAQQGGRERDHRSIRGEGM